MKHFFIQMVCIIIMLIITSTLFSCNAKRNGFSFANDSIITKEISANNDISDSILNIMMNANRVQANLYVSSMDTIREIASKNNLNREDMGALKLSLLLSEIHETDAIVYGRFLPKVSFLFSKGKEACTIEVDFGLNQLKVILINSKLTFTIYNDILLKETVLLFPNDDFLPFLLKQQK